ncbi:hypothetical protein [Ferruginibacter sp. SUN106]|uniref:hypothetical protein n=1 Tax=Ferruginibacter sp. SUN106 TaxID=2978348 RepID=UPI003D35DAF0
MTKLYLDWNIITNLRQPENLVTEEDIFTFDTLKRIINSSSQNLLIPYSNAHLNDLLKSYNKGERLRVEESLNFISELTQNVSLIQYWNEETAKWHYRDPKEYFQDILENGDGVDASSLEAILEPLKEYGLGNLFDIFKTFQHNIDFTQLDNYNSTLSLLFRKSRSDNSMYAVMEDFISLFNDLKTNPTVYNELRALFRNAIPIDGGIHNSDNVIEMLDKTMSKTMLNKSFTEFYDENNKSKALNNNDYSKLTGIFMQLDFVGYSSDKLTDKNQYDNLFNDALHCFYAAHCDYFITSDKKMYKKTKAVFQSENIVTEVMKPREFIDFILEA